jgi:uncharacterized membrane protein
MMNIRGFFNKHVGQSDDYKAKDSLVNKARRNGMSKAVVGAGIGAAVGGAAGFAAGTYNLSRDEVSIGDSVKQLTRPSLIGADYDSSYTYTTTSTDADGNTTTHFHHEPADWDPIIERVATGQTEEKQVIEHSTLFGPVAGTLVGGAIGAVVGALATSLTDIVKDDLPNRWDNPSRWRNPHVPETEDKQKLARAADAAPYVGAAAGAVVGAGAGALVGQMAAAKNITLEQVIQEPIYENRLIGHIPRVSQKRTIPRSLFHSGQKIYYNELPDNRWGETPFSDKGQRIVRRYFTGDYKSVQTVEQSQWLTPLRGALLGGTVGAVTGLATGVAAGVLMKMAAGEDPPRS